MLASKQSPSLKWWTANKPWPEAACCTLCLPRLSLHKNAGKQNPRPTVLLASVDMGGVQLIHPNAYEPWAGARAGGAVKASIQKSIFFKYSDLAIAWRSKNSHAFFSVKVYT